MKLELLPSIVRKLESDHDGEVLAAARILRRMAAEQKKNMAELLMGSGQPTIIYRDRIVEKTVYRDRPQRSYEGPSAPPDEGGILGSLRWAAQFPQHLNDWERDFIQSVLADVYWDADMTFSQATAARRIIRKVKARESEPLL